MQFITTPLSIVVALFFAALLGLARIFGIRSTPPEERTFCREHYFGMATSGSPCTRCSCLITANQPCPKTHS